MVLFIFVVVWNILRILDVSCLFYRLTSIPCPTCGMTRALNALLRGDFVTYMKYNAFALPVALVFMGEMVFVGFKKTDLSFHSFSVTILVFNFIYYLIRLFTKTIL